MKIKRFHYLGCSIAIIGILVVGASNVIFADNSGGGDNDAVLINIILEISNYWIYINYSFSCY
jgi:hypothetical protein